MTIEATAKQFEDLFTDLAELKGIDNGLDGLFAEWHRAGCLLELTVQPPRGIPDDDSKYQDLRQKLEGMAGVVLGVMVYRAQRDPEWLESVAGPPAARVYELLLLREAMARVLDAQ